MENLEKKVRFIAAVGTIAGALVLTSANKAAAGHWCDCSEYLEAYGTAYNSCNWNAPPESCPDIVNCYVTDEGGMNLAWFCNDAPPGGCQQPSPC